MQRPSEKKFQNKLISVIGKLSKYKAIVLSLAVVVVFVTTYLLILPAFTLDKDDVAYMSCDAHTVWYFIQCNKKERRCKKA